MLRLDSVDAERTSALSPASSSSMSIALSISKQKLHSNNTFFNSRSSTSTETTQSSATSRSSTSCCDTTSTSGGGYNCGMNFPSEDFTVPISGNDKRSVSNNMVHVVPAGMRCDPEKEKERESPSSSSSEQEAIYYFGYGPIVNPIVRLRRGCTIPPRNIQTAILYDHRLRFVEGGTANIVPSRGWDVKGVLLKFNNPQEWQQFRKYDANYEVREVSVSVMDKTNIDPKNKNDKTAPFDHSSEDDGNDDGNGNDDTNDDDHHEDNDNHHHEDNGGPIHKNHRLSYGDEDEDDDDDDSSSDISCPFKCAPSPNSSQNERDRNAIRCLTFMIEQPAGGSKRHSRCATGSCCSDSDTDDVVGKPQERYLKLITDGLRAHEIDETYIRDEILAANYIPNERDKVVSSVSKLDLDLGSSKSTTNGTNSTGSSGYRKFPLSMKPYKLPKISTAKYETKLCATTSSDDRAQAATYFICGRNKVMKLQQDNVNVDDHRNNPCVKWLRAQAAQDITLLVHQTFIDPDCDCLHLLPLVDTIDDLTPRHYEWAEHTILLYLERGGLTATVVYELTSDNNRDNNKRGSIGLKGVGRSMPSLTASMGRFSLKNRSSNFGSSINSSNTTNSNTQNDQFNLRRSAVQQSRTRSTTTATTTKVSARQRHSMLNLPNRSSLLSSVSEPTSGGGRNARFSAPASMSMSMSMRTSSSSAVTTSMRTDLLSNAAAAAAAAGQQQQQQAKSSTTKLKRAGFSFGRLKKTTTFD